MKSIRMSETTMKALNRLAKWRVLLTGWQLGTREKGDPEGDAVRDHREVTLLLRAEVNALVYLLVEKDLVSEAEWNEALAREAELLQRSLEGRFPGVKATDDGLTIDPRRAASWMGKWKP